MNTAPERANGYQVELGLAARQCELYYGASWYWNPARWGTSDGYVPFGILWDAWRTLQSLTAWQRLQTMQAFILAQPVPDERRHLRDQAVQRETDLAYPPPEPA